MRQPIPPPYSYIRVKLPNFLIIAMREMVKDSNKERPGEPRWSVSRLLEAWLMKAFTIEDINAMAKGSKEFRREAEAWIRWTVEQKREIARRAARQSPDRDRL